MLCPEIIPEKESRTLPTISSVKHDDEFLRTLEPWQRKIYTATPVIETRENFNRFAQYILPGFSKFNKKSIESIAADTSLPGIPEPVDFRYQGPTLVITGRQSNMVGYQDAYNMLDNYPHASYALLDKAGHTAHLDQPEVVSTLIEEWLDQMAASRTESVEE